MVRRTRLLYPVCLVLASVLVPLASASELPERLSLEWIHGEEVSDITATASYRFVDGGGLLRYDDRLPEEERTIEILDPETGRVLTKVDPVKALASLDELLGGGDEEAEGEKAGDAKQEEEEAEELGLPSAISPGGTHGLYGKKGDLFLLDFATSTFERLTETDGREEAARFSPDGARLAFVRDNDLYVVSLETKKEKRLTKDGSETTLNGTLSWVYWEELFGRRDRGYLFSPDGAQIAYFQFDESPVDVMTYVDPDPAATRVIRQRYPKAGTTNPRVRAGVVDVKDGKTTWIDLGTYPYEYLARLVWLPDGERLVAQTLDRSQENLDLFLVEAGSGKARHLFRETDPAWIDVHDDLIFLDDGKRFVWASDREGHSHLFLYELTGEGARLVRALTQGDWSVSGGARRASGLGGTIAVVDEERGALYFMGKKKSHLETHLYRVGLDGTGLEQVTEAAGSHSTRWSHDGKYFLDAHSGLERPSSTDLRRADGALVRTLIEPSREIADHFGFSKPELITVQAEDGFELPAIVLKPHDFDPQQVYPAVVNIYGGPASPVVRNRWYGSLYDHLLTAEGFLLFYVDPRTSTAMGKPTTRLLLRDFYSDRETNDIVAGVRWLKTLDYVDADRVGITGWSGGGTTTVAAMSRTKEFRAGIAGAGVYNWFLYDTIYTERYMKHPDDNAEGYEKNDLVETVGNLHGRLLLLHGTYDDNVHPQNTWQLVDELIESGIVFDLGVYPMRKHGFRDDEARLHRDKTRFEFWQRELGPDSEPLQLEKDTAGEDSAGR
ncbi:MAG: S9 family peptidase [Thermoanaerobaculia bacterium]|nr:S9 family peptidase [Thermoanaerobaculia bacterium]